jgi:ATP phosphoribosyltransferase
MIFNRLKTATFTKSSTKVKMTAPKSTLPNIQISSGTMSQPHPANVAAINTSAIEEMHKPKK